MNGVMVVEVVLMRKKTGSRLKEPIIWFCRKFLYSIGFIYEKYLAFTLLYAEFLILFLVTQSQSKFRIQFSDGLRSIIVTLDSGSDNDIISYNFV